MGKKLEEYKAFALADPLSWESEMVEYFGADYEDPAQKEQIEIDIFYDQASKGGELNAIKNAKYLLPERTRIFDQMQEYLEYGHSISRAATFTFTRHGLGKSAEANRQRWHYNKGNKR